MTMLEQARAMQCLGKIIEAVELDPDPTTQDKLTARNDCTNCKSHDYCCELSDTLTPAA